MNYKIIFPIVLTAILSGCASEVPVVEESLTPVTASTITPSTIENVMVYAGRIEPSQSISVASKIAGKVEAIYFDIGDKVNTGDVLFSLDEQDIANQVRQLESQLDIAEQGVKTAENSLSSVTGGQFQTQVLQLETGIKNASKQIEAAELALQNSELVYANAQLGLQNAMDALENITTTYENAKTLYESGSLAKADYDKAELGLKQAAAAVEQAQSGVEQAALGRVQAQVTYDQASLGLEQAVESYDLTTDKVVAENKEKAGLGISQALASKNAVEIQLDIARSTLSDTDVTAPITGVISAKTAKAGEFTSTQLPAYTIVDLSKVNVEVRVSEVLINNIYVGEEVDVIISTLGGDTIKGEIITISPAADQTSTFPVKIQIDNSDSVIKPGMFAEVHFVKDHSENTLVLPRNSVFDDESGRYVYIADNGEAKKLYVTTGIDNGQNIEIISGLTSSERVIVKGQTYLNDGDKIKVVEE